MRPCKMALDQWLSAPLCELALSLWATNCLESEGIATVRDLVVRSDEELLEVRNFGESPLQEVKYQLQERGLRLRMKKNSDGVWIFGDEP
jgi:DNA-directed RNA polymerase subunit alpha